MNSGPKFSIVIPVRNEEECISQCLNSLLNQTYKNFEIIIVDDGSTDNTVNIIKSYIKRSNKINLILGSKCGPSYARNIGVKRARGEVIVFIDGDNYVNQKVLEYAFKRFKNKNVAGISVSVKYNSGKGIWAKMQDAWSSFIYGETTGLAILYRKEIIDSIGGFKANILLGEDLDLFLRAKKYAKKRGMFFVCEKNAVLIQSYENKPLEIFKHSFRAGERVNTYIKARPKYGILVLFSRLFFASPILTIPIFALSFYNILHIYFLIYIFVWLFLFIFKIKRIKTPYLLLAPLLMFWRGLAFTLGFFSSIFKGL